MTGLNLETFLRLARADLGAWASLGVVAAILAVMTWTSWGSRRALRKCLVLSIAVHVGLVVYGSRSPEIRRALRLDAPEKRAKAERSVRITPWAAEKSATGPDGRPRARVADWDLDRNSLALGDPPRPASPTASAPAPGPTRSEPTRSAPEPVAPEVQGPAASIAPITRPEAGAPEAPPGVAEADPSEVAAPVEPEAAPPALPPPTAVRPRPGVRRPAPGRAEPSRAEPGRARPSAPGLPEPSGVDLPPSRVSSGAVRVPSGSENSGGAVAPSPSEVLDPGPPAPPTPVAVPSPAEPLPGPDLRRAPRPSRGTGAGSAATAPSRSADGLTPPSMARATPSGPSAAPTSPRPTLRRSLSDVPMVYRSRLDPNRTSLAQRAGATQASEQAVERALDWLARHQDAADGRWDGGTTKYRDGTVYNHDDSFTIHCPAGEVCFGECFYPEADTGLTGLSLLAFLGAGYTHLDGKFAPVVGKGVEFLIGQQKPDGDLRGTSVSVGMYCHSMATLALCEAYALTGDANLRGPVERALDFLVKARAVDGLAWRYEPRADVGDTSILGWAVMALKSGRTVGIPIPPPTQAGILGWLKRVGAGRDGGLALYQPGEKSTPTMTAEAWACRQFLEVGGPGPASEEAAGHLLRNRTDRGEYNIYYLYYGTLAMYQHGGDAWSTWNARVRDEVVNRQRVKGHMAGSWDPDDSPYGTKGGRIYGTALATLTLEVYYRFLRLYEPSPTPPPPPVAPRPGGDAGTRRAGFEPGR